MAYATYATFTDQMWLSVAVGCVALLIHCLLNRNVLCSLMKLLLKMFRGLKTRNDQ